MAPLGVMEIFYGEAWTPGDRESYARFLKEIGFHFYVYGPKADESLRRNWQKPWTLEERTYYQALRHQFSSQGLKFGMALSPFGLHESLGLVERTKLQDKLRAIADLGADILGLYFDDMKSAKYMAEKQLEILEIVRATVKMQVLFCPSYYCHDPLLDFLFGERPPQYLEKIGAGVHHEVDILWTGEQIISHHFAIDQLQAVTEVLRRQPFICDNFYSNDGPINCNYLRLVPPSGRPREVLDAVRGWAINPMNQAQLSKLVIEAFAQYLVVKDIDPERAFADTIRAQCSPWVADLIFNHSKFFAEAGLDALPPTEQIRMRKHLSGNNGRFERELLKWLDNHYAVGMEALLNQSCFDGT